MDYYLGEKYPHQYITDGTEYSFYSIGSFWDYSNPAKGEGSIHYGFMIGRGLPELINEGGYDEPPFYEPSEYEMIIARPKLKYPKR